MIKYKINIKEINKEIKETWETLLNRLVKEQLEKNNVSNLNKTKTEYILKKLIIKSTNTIISKTDNIIKDYFKENIKQGEKLSSLGLVVNHNMVTRKGAIDIAAMEADGIDVKRYMKEDATYSVISITLEQKENEVE